MSAQPADGVDGAPADLDFPARAADAATYGCRQVAAVRVHYAAADGDGAARAVMIRPDASDELGAFGGNRPAADGDGLARRDRCASTRLTERFDSASGNNELACSNAITARYSRMSENRAARYRDGRVRLSQDARLTTCACSHGIQGSLAVDGKRRGASNRHPRRRLQSVAAYVITSHQRERRVRGSLD